MVLSLSCANFGSAALQKSLNHFPTNASMNRAGELNVGTWRSEGWGRWRNQEKMWVWGLPGPFLKGGGESILQESKLSDLNCSSSAKPFRTSKIPHLVERTQISYSPQTHWCVLLTKTLDTTLSDSKVGQRELKYLKEKEFSPRYVLSPHSPTPEFGAGVGCRGLWSFLFLSSSASNQPLLPSLSRTKVCTMKGVSTQGRAQLTSPWSDHCDVGSFINTVCTLNKGFVFVLFLVCFS